MNGSSLSLLACFQVGNYFLLFESYLWFNWVIWPDSVYDFLFISDLNKAQITSSRHNISLISWLSSLGQLTRNPAHSGAAFFYSIYNGEERKESGLEKTGSEFLVPPTGSWKETGSIMCLQEDAEVGPLYCHLLKDHHQQEHFPPFFWVRLSNSYVSIESCSLKFSYVLC